MAEINKQEWQDWFEHPITEEFFKRLREEREDAMEALANGLFADNPGKQNIYVGLISGLTKIINASYEG